MEYENYKISEEQLAEEIAIALKDFFDAEISYASGKIDIVFKGGEAFTLSVKKAE